MCIRDSSRSEFIGSFAAPWRILDHWSRSRSRSCQANRPFLWGIGLTENLFHDMRVVYLEFWYGYLGCPMTLRSLLLLTYNSIFFFARRITCPHNTRKLSTKSCLNRRCVPFVKKRLKPSNICSSIVMWQRLSGKLSGKPSALGLLNVALHSYLWLWRILYLGSSIWKMISIF